MNPPRPRRDSYPLRLTQQAKPVVLSTLFLLQILRKEELSMSNVRHELKFWVRHSATTELFFNQQREQIWKGEMAASSLFCCVGFLLLFVFSSNAFRVGIYQGTDSSAPGIVAYLMATEQFEAV